MNLKKNNLVKVKMKPNNQFYMKTVSVFPKCLFVLTFFTCVQHSPVQTILIKNVNWCVSPYCEKKSDHTICRHGATCPPAEGCETHIDFNKEMKDYILELHNEIRNKIALGDNPNVPTNIRKVANLNVLQWDIHLEFVARCHSRQCDAKHDQCRVVPRFSTVGQNIYTNKFSGGQAEKVDVQDIIEEAVEAWHRQQKNVPKDVYEKWTETEKPSAEFTQMIWATTGFIGCGISQRKTDEFIEFFLVCNYGRQGNIEGRSIYTPGEPCTKCLYNKKCNSKYKGLCGNIDEYAKKCPCEEGEGDTNDN